MDIKSQTIELIDKLKAITFTAGKGGGGDEYTILVETFLYKFLNDKFIYEAKKTHPVLGSSEDIYTTLEEMSPNDYEETCDKMFDTIELKKEHLLPHLAAHQNDENFAELFDSTLLDIANTNKDIFFIQNSDNTRIPILQPITEMIRGGAQKRNDFCKSIIGALSTFSFESAFSKGYDFFSTIFEYLIKDYNMNSGGTYAEYYTPHSIAMIMAQLLVNPGDNIRSVSCYDPSAGTGTLIIALAHYIGENNCSIYTQDISDKSTMMMMLNLILNGLTHSLQNVIQGNTLAYPFHKEANGRLKKFDYIVSNPPFKLDISEYRDKLVNDSYEGRFFAGIPNIPKKDKKKMEIYLCFLQHIIYSLNDNGKAAIVVPTGFLTATTGIAKKIRENMVEKRMLKGAVSMPSNIFANTGTNVSVIFLDKANTAGKVILMDASKLGETVKENGIQKTKLSDDDISKIVTTFQKKESIENFSVSVSYDDLKEKNYSLSAGQYFDIKINYVDITEEEFKNRLEKRIGDLNIMFNESHELEKEILKNLNSLKFNDNSSQKK